MTNPAKRINYLSWAYHGSCHDFSIMKTEFPETCENWFRNLNVHVDLGFKGFAKRYKCLKLFIPDKKPRNKELTKEQKKLNKSKSQNRVVVENAIGGMKRYRFLSDRLRCHRIEFFNKISGIAVGLWNLNLTFTND